MMSHYEGEYKIVRVENELSEEIEAKVGMHQGCVLSSYPLAVVADAVTE